MSSKEMLVTMVGAVAVLAAGESARAQEAQPVAQVLEPISVEDANERRSIETRTAVSPEDIQSWQPQDLKQLFDGNPAFAVGGGAAISQKFYLHGIDQNNLNVTVDGARQKNNMWHHDGSMQIDPAFLKQVEVDPGVAPADAGPGALGGAVRFETKDAADLLAPGQALGGDLTAGYDTNSETWKTTGAAYGRHSGFEVFGIGSWANGNDYTNGDGDRELGTETDAQSVLGKVAYEATNGNRLELTSEYLHDDANRRLRPNMGLVSPAMNDTKATRWTSTLQYQTTAPTELFDPEVLLAYNRNTIDRPFETTNRGAFESELGSFSGHAQNRFRIGLGTITAGVDFYDDRGDVQGFDPAGNTSLGRDGDETATNLGAYLQARLVPVERLSVSTGLRADYQWYEAVDGQDYGNGGLSPNISAEYALSPYFSLFGGYSYTFGGIQMGDIVLFHAAPYEYPDNLDPTTAHNSRAGVRARYEGLSGEFALFDTRIKNSIAWSYPPPTGTRIEADDLKSQGFDLSGRFDWRDGFVSAAYTYVDTTYGNRTALPGDYDNGLAVGDSLTLAAVYSPAGWGVSTGVSAEFASDVDDSDLYDNGFVDGIQGYRVFNAFAAWTPAFFDRLTLRAEANNIFDEQYYSRGTYPETGNVTPVYAPGRSFYLSASIRF